MSNRHYGQKAWKAARKVVAGLLVLAGIGAMAQSPDDAEAKHHQADLTTINARLLALSNRVNAASATLPALTPGACPNAIYTTDSPTPIMVPIQTRIINGPANSASSYGIQVGSTLYTAPNTGTTNAFQALELDRASLNCVANLTFDASLQNGTSQFLERFQASDCGLAGCMLIVQSLQTVPANSCVGECVTWGVALSYYGGSARLDTIPGNQSGSVGYSLITNLTSGSLGPGTERLTCFGSSCPSNTILAAENGVISGVVVPGNNNNGYTFQYPGRVSYDTGTGSSPYKNTITIGANLWPGTFSGSYPSAEVGAGFQVVVLTKDSLQLQSNDTFDINHLSIGQSGNDSMESILASAVSFPNSVVIVSSIGPLEHDPRFNEAWGAVGNQIANLGGTYSVFRNLGAGDTYSLVGGSGYSHGAGAKEVSTKIRKATVQGASPLARQTGTLARDRFGNLQPKTVSYGPITTSVESSLIAPFDAIALSAPTPWPYTSTPGEQAVYAELSSLLCSCTSGPALHDIRSQYRDDLLAISNWQYELLKFMTPEKGYDPTDWNNVANELGQEFIWLGNARKAETTFANFYTDSQFGMAETLSKIHTQLENSLPSAKHSTVSPVWTELLADGQTIGKDVIALVPGGALGFDLLMSGVNLGFAIGDNTHGANQGVPLTASLSVEFSDLKTEAGDVFQSAKSALANSFDLIYSDPLRLQTVSDLETNNVIVWETPQQAAAQKGTGYSMEREFAVQLAGSVYTIGEWSGQSNLQAVCTQYTSQQNCYDVGTRYAHCGSVFCDTTNSSASVTASIASKYSSSLPASVYNTFLVVPSVSNVACDGNGNAAPFENFFGALNPTVNPATATQPINLGIYKSYYFLYDHGNSSVQVNQTCSNNHPD